MKEGEPRKLLPDNLARFAPRRVFGRIYRELTGKQRESYCDKTNRELLEKGIIQSPLTGPKSIQSRISTWLTGREFPSIK